MQIAIVGAGAVGGYFGGYLSKAGNNVLFLARSSHYEQMKQNGLKIVGEGGQFVIHETFTNTYQDLSDADYVLFCVKSIHTSDIAQQLLPVLKKEAMILTLQNGVDNEEILSNVFGKERVISVATYIQASIATNGVIKQAGSPPLLMIGALDSRNTAHVEKVVSLFNQAGIKAKSTDEIVKIKWQKLLWNVSFNPLSAITETKIGEILADEALLKLAKTMCYETVAVADKLGIIIDQRIYEGIFLHSHVADQHNTSMLQDKLNNKPMELDSICGYIVNKGKEVGVSTPVIETIYQLLKFHEASITATASRLQV